MMRGSRRLLAARVCKLIEQLLFLAGSLCSARYCATELERRLLSVLLFNANYKSTAAHVIVTD